MKKKIGIKNLKYCDWASEETNCFSATVTVDDEDFCTAQDEGRGGSIQFRPIKNYNYEPIEKLDLWCISNLPKWSVKGLDKSLDTTLEIAVADSVQVWYSATMTIFNPSPLGVDIFHYLTPKV